jgi:hypothetical protein
MMSESLSTWSLGEGNQDSGSEDEDDSSGFPRAVPRSRGNRQIEDVVTVENVESKARVCLPTSCVLCLGGDVEYLQAGYE